MPARAPPPGGDRNIGGRLVVLQSVLISFATIFIALRLYVRSRVIRALGLDDFFIVLALLLGWVLFAFGILAVDSGQGRHAYYLSKKQLTTFGRLVHIALPITTLATACSRLSISLFLLRIVAPGRRWKYSLWALIIFIAINNVAMFVSAYLQCIPIRKMWNASVPGTCWSESAQSATNIWQATFSIACDFVLAILPVIFLWDVRISPRRKIGICVLIGLGVVTGVCAIVRTVLTIDPVSVRLDPTWDTMDEAICSTLEELFLLIVASLPALPPLFRRDNYRSAYVPDEETSGARRLKPKTLYQDPYAIADDDPLPPSMDSEIFASRPSNFSEAGSEIRLHDYR